MRKQYTILIAAAMTCVGLAVHAETPTASAGIDVVSAYVFRGATVVDDWNVNPWLEGSAHGVTFGTWGNFNTSSTSEQFDEIDYYISYGLPLGEDSPIVADVAYTEYTFPTQVDTNGIGLEADREISLGLGLNVDNDMISAINPTLLVAFGLEGPFLDESIYFELGGGYELPIDEDHALSTGIAVGFEAGDQVLNTGVSHVTLSAGTGHGPFSITLNYVIETDDDVITVDEDFYVSIGVGI